MDVSTVSRALNDSPLVRDEVKAKIKRIAKRLNYVPNLAGFSLRTKMTKTISLVFPYLKFPGGEFYDEISRGIDKIIEENKFSIILSDLSAKPINYSSFYRIISEGRIDGAIVVGDIFSESDLKKINQLKIPILLINQKIDSKFKNIVNIFQNNAEGVKLVAEHLIKVHNRKNILFIGGGERYQTSQEREKGFLETAVKYNVNYKIIQGAYDVASSGYKIIEDLINKNEFNFDGIICGNDDIAFAVIKCLADKKLLSKNISVVGYDNIQASKFFIPSLTTIDPCAYEMGEKAGELIIKWILEKKMPSETRIEFLPKIVIRESCGCS